MSSMPRALLVPDNVVPMFVLSTCSSAAASLDAAARDASDECVPLGVATEEGRGSLREGAVRHTSSCDAAASAARADRAFTAPSIWWF